MATGGAGKVKVLPEAFLKCMKPEDRKALGQMSAEEAIVAFSNRQEKDLQKLIGQELRRRGIVAITSGMHRRSSTKPGTPDFCFVARDITPQAAALWAHGRPVPWAVECKTSTGQLRPEQAEMLKQMGDNGWNVLVCRSFEQFKQEVFGA